MRATLVSLAVGILLAAGVVLMYASLAAKAGDPELVPERFDGRRLVQLELLYPGTVRRSDRTRTRCEQIPGERWGQRYLYVANGDIIREGVWCWDWSR